MVMKIRVMTLAIVTAMAMNVTMVLMLVMMTWEGEVATELVGENGATSTHINKHAKTSNATNVV